MLNANFFFMGRKMKKYAEKNICFFPR